MDIHEASEIASFKNLYGDTFIDVGANQGRWTVALAENFKSIWAFEPNVHAYRILFDNVNCYGIERGKLDMRYVHIINAAASNYTGMGVLRCYESTTWSTLLNRNPGMEEGREPVESMDVDIWKIDDIPPLKDCRIDLMKIDTEGGEVQVIEGALKLLNRDKPSLHIEAHTFEDVPHIKALLPWADFQVTYVDGRRSWMVYRKGV